MKLKIFSFENTMNTIAIKTVITVSLGMAHHVSVNFIHYIPRPIEVNKIRKSKLGTKQNYAQQYMQRCQRLNIYVNIY